MTQWGAAEAILREIGIATPADIDLERITRHLNVVVKRRRLDSCEARIVGFGDRAIVSVDDRLGPTRTRFSIAHELGHWRFHRGRTFVCRPSESGGQGRNAGDPERVADAYAADLLLPDFLFKPMLRGLGTTSLDVVRDLAATFRASFTATAIRMVERGAAPAMLVCHAPRGRRWFVRNPCVPKRWFPRQKPDPASLTHRALLGGSPRSGPGRVGAEVWFDRTGAEDYEIWEEARRVGDCVVTLLLFPDERMLKESWRGIDRPWR